MPVDIRITGAGGEYMEDVTVVEWRAAPGDTVRAGETVAVVETAKAATDIEAPADGILQEILIPAGAEAPVGAVLGRIGDGTPANGPPETAGSAPPPPADAEDAAEERRVEAAGPPVRPRAARPGKVVASPLARKVAARRGVDLSAVTGTGPGGRIKRRDVEAAAETAPAPAPARAARPAGTVTAAGLHVERAPAAEATNPAPVVFLHGFGADTLVWRAVLPALDAGLDAVMVDLPGHGRSAPARGDTVEDLAEAVGRALDAAGHADCHLVAHSLGAAVALALVGAGSVAARSLVLIAPAGLDPTIDAAFLDAFTAAEDVDALAAAMAPLFADETPLPAGFARAVHRRRSDPRLRAGQAALARTLFPEGRQAFDGRAALAAFAGPARVIRGGADRIIPPGGEGLPPATALHVFPGVGHMPHVEAAATVARLVSETARSAR